MFLFCLCVCSSLAGHGTLCPGCFGRTIELVIAPAKQSGLTRVMFELLRGSSVLLPVAALVDSGYLSCCSGKAIGFYQVLFELFAESCALYLAP